MAVGDVALFPSIQEAWIDREESPFAEVSDTLSQADLVFANFEFPFTKEANPRFAASYSGYSVDLRAREVLSTAKIDVCSLANNHIMDWGLEGLRTTESTLQQYGIQSTGAGNDESEACKPVVLEREGIRFGFLAYAKRGDYIASKCAPGAALYEAERVISDIVSLKSEVDHIVVSVHWGVEFSDYPLPIDVKISHRMIDAGASLILGHHPHTLQGFEEYAGGMIYYSLGNFIYDPMSERIQSDAALRQRYETCIVRVEFNAESLVDSEIIPVKIDETSLRPRILSGQEAQEVLSRLQTISQEMTSLGGAHIYGQAAGNLMSRELKTYGLLWKKHGWRFLWPRLKSIRIRHLKLLFGFLWIKMLRLFRRDK